jgi:hypothetical protein
MTVKGRCFDTDPNYNGEHLCPKCEGPATWKGVNMEGRIIRVTCPDHGTFEMPYKDIANELGLAGS